MGATVAVTVTAVTAFVAVRPEARIGPRLAGCFLLLFGILFVVRVAGQVLVRLRRPTWLPPTEEWNLMPYRYLLPAQIAILAVIAWLVSGFLAGSAPVTHARGPVELPEWLGPAAGVAGLPSVDHVLFPLEPRFEEHSTSEV
ncbi:MAG: hypothetical protein KY396_06365 [Actinobacteria bacterium]|nr:hypothetical protein [Actinomycetota bacterium]